jgi:hypothetical protein
MKIDDRPNLLETVQQHPDYLTHKLTQDQLKFEQMIASRGRFNQSEVERQEMKTKDMWFYLILAFAFAFILFYILSPK